MILGLFDFTANTITDYSINFVIQEIVSVFWGMRPIIQYLEDQK